MDKQTIVSVIIQLVKSRTEGQPFSSFTYMGGKIVKLKQIKMYSFGRSSISEGVISSENLEENIVTLTDSFLMMALECYKNEKIKDGQ